MDSDGDFVVAWSGVDADVSGIFARRFAADGTAKDANEFLVNTTTVESQSRPTVAMDAVGNFVVTWDSDTDPSNSENLDIFFQRYDAAGNALGTETQVNTDNGVAQSIASVAMNASGAFVIAWESDDDPSPSATDLNIYFQRYDAAGNAQGVNTMANSITANDQSRASIDIAADGSFVIAWQSFNGTDNDVYVREFDNAGNPRAAESRANTTTALDQRAPSIGMSDAGGYLVAWSGNGAGDDDGVFAQQYIIPDTPATIAGDTSYSGNEGEAVSGTLTATDAEGLTDGTYFSVTTPATNGTAAIDAATGAWTFTPTDPNWFGTDSFTVTVTDDLGGTTTQVVSITLANVDDPATIGGNTSYTGNEGDAVTGTLTATDVDGLTDGTYFSVTTPASNGTAAIDAATGAWTFSPTDPNWFGSDSFTVTVTDDLGGTTTQVVNITLANVDDPATISGDVSFSGNEGDAVGGTMAATDVEGLTDGTYFAVTTPAANGTAAIDPASGAWTFTPTDANWFGTDSFTVTVTDDLGGTTTQVVNITLANVDDPGSSPAMSATRATRAMRLPAP